MVVEIYIHLLMLSNLVVLLLLRYKMILMLMIEFERMIGISAVQEERRKGHGGSSQGFLSEEDNSRQRFRLLVDRLIAAEKELTEDTRPLADAVECGAVSLAQLIEECLRDTVEWAMKVPSFVDLTDDVKSSLLASGKQLPFANKIVFKDF